MNKSPGTCRVDLEAMADESAPLADRIDRLLEGYGDRPALVSDYSLDDVENNGA